MYTRRQHMEGTNIKMTTWPIWREPQTPGHLCVWLGLTWSGGIQNWPRKMGSGIVHHKSDRKPCVILTADRNRSWLALTDLANSGFTSSETSKLKKRFWHNLSRDMIVPSFMWSNNQEIICIIYLTLHIQSPQKESIHFCRVEYSKLRGARRNVGGCDAPPTFPLATLDFEYLALPQV